MTEETRTKRSFVRTKTAYAMYRGGRIDKPIPHWDKLDEWVREAITGTIRAYNLMSARSDDD